MPLTGSGSFLIKLDVLRRFEFRRRIQDEVTCAYTQPRPRCRYQIQRQKQVLAREVAGALRYFAWGPIAAKVIRSTSAVPATGPIDNYPGDILLQWRFAPSGRTATSRHLSFRRPPSEAASRSLCARSRAKSYCDNASTVKERNLANVSPSLRLSLNSAELRQRWICSMLSHAVMETRRFGASLSSDVTFCPAASSRPPFARMMACTFGA
jgi:hypothetical protein